MIEILWIIGRPISKKDIFATLGKIDTHTHNYIDEGESLLSLRFETHSDTMCEPPS